MKKQKWVNPKTDKLFNTILNIEDLSQARSFFRDLLTEQEIEEFANRWEVAVMLANNISYSKITKNTGMSSTTIARISKWLNKGMGGYKSLINKLEAKSKIHHHVTTSGMI